MSQEGYADPITNDGPGFHSNMPVRELTERVAQEHQGKQCSFSPFGGGNRRQGNAWN